MKKTLVLPLKRQWFEMTKTGIKKEEYREINSYWFKRLVFDYKKVAEYYSINPNDDSQIQGFCSVPFWLKTIAFIPFDYNLMLLGYPKLTDTERVIKLEHKGIEIREGNTEWGAEPKKLYFVIKHGQIIK